MTPTFEPPKQWEDWVSWALGIWLVLSPWIVMFWMQTSAMENAVIVGFLLILVEAVTLSSFRLWEEWLNVLLGVWLVASTVVLGLSGWATVANFVIVGALVIILAAYEMWDIKRRLAVGA